MRFLVARTCRKIHNVDVLVARTWKTMKNVSSDGQNTYLKSDVLVARTWKNCENRVLWWPEQIEHVKNPMFWWPEHAKPMKITCSKFQCSGGQNMGKPMTIVSSGGQNR